MKSKANANKARAVAKYLHESFLQSRFVSVGQKLIILTQNSMNSVFSKEVWNCSIHVAFV